MLNKILSVSELSHKIKSTLINIGLVWIKGEVASITLAGSGHWYLTLKDESSQIKCIMFKQKALYASFIPKQGQQIEIFGQIELYEARGDIQIIIESVRAVGIGALYEAFLYLKTKLQTLGMFNLEYKKPIPKNIQAVGIITSLEAAALADVLKTMQLKVPFIKVFIYPCLVQGIMASKTIIEQIEYANQQNIVDVLIVCRGGGSLEDLSAYNDESLAISIFNSDLPIITGIGHETDTSIADLVSSHRCATPTACVDMLGDSIIQKYNQLASYNEYFKLKIQDKLQNYKNKLDSLVYPFVNSKIFLAKYTQQIIYLRSKINIDNNLYKQQQKLQLLKNSLQTSVKFNLLNLKNSQQKYNLLFSRLNPALKITLENIYFLDEQNNPITLINKLKTKTNYSLYFNQQKALVSFDKIEIIE